VLNYMLHYEGIWGSGGIGPEINGVKVSIMPKPLYFQGNSPHYTLSRKLGGPQK